MARGSLSEDTLGPHFNSRSNTRVITRLGKGFVDQLEQGPQRVRDWLRRAIFTQVKSLPALLYVGGTGDFLDGLITFIACSVHVQMSLSFKANAKKGKLK